MKERPQPILGKVVKSNAHTDYVCQIYGLNEIDPVPEPEQYALGTFVKLELADGEQPPYLVGLIYDTVLLNPDFNRLGPRLSSERELMTFAPDYLSERAVLVGITAIGRVRANDEPIQGVPRLAVKSDALVRGMSVDEIVRFHTSGRKVDLSYLPLLVKLDNALAYHLGRIVLLRLMEMLPEYREALDVLEDDLGWLTQISPLGGVQ